MDPVAICNMALGAFGANRIESVDTDTAESQEEELCASFYAPTVTQLLEDAAPLFATTLVDLGARQDSPLAVLGSGLVAAFVFDSSNFVRPLSCDDGGGTFTIKWERNGSFLVCEDTDKLFCRAVQLITDPNKWTPSFQWAVAYQLASVISGPITHSASIEKEMSERAMYWYKKACNLDGMAGTTNTQYRANSTSLANRRS